MTGPSGSKFAIIRILKKPRGLFCTEMPEARFEDILTFHVTDTVTEIAIDPLFIDSCAPRSIHAISLVSNKWAPLGAVVVGDKLRVHHKDGSSIEDDLIVTVKLSGIRRGTKDRFPVFSEEQMEANNRFWSAAYE